MKVKDLTGHDIGKKFFHDEYGILKLDELKEECCIFYSKFGINSLVTITLDGDDDLILLGGLI